jgi:Ca-activated chloride channel family protein
LFGNNHFLADSPGTEEIKKSGKIMKNEDLKNILNSLPIPEPTKEAKDKAVGAALAEFRRQSEEKKKKVKGSSWLERLMGKNRKGGPIMTRSIAITTAGITVGFIALVITLSPVFVAQKAHILKRGTVQVATRQNLVEKSQISTEQKPLVPRPGESRNEAKKEVVAYNASKPDGSLHDSLTPAESDLNSQDKYDLEEITVTGTRTPMRQEAKTKGRSAPAGAVPAVLSSAKYPMQEGMRPPVDQTYVGRDQFETVTANTVKLVSEAPVSTFSIDVDTASYAFVRRSLNSGYLPPKNAVRIEEMINYFDYAYPLPEDRSVPFKPTVSVFPTPWNPDTKLLHIGIKGYDIVPAKKPRSNLVFLIDVSGSMESQDKLPLLKNSLRLLVNTLEPDDTVAIVVYAGAAGTVLEPTKASEKGKIIAALDRLQAGGSTAGGEGINMAYSLAEANMDPNGVNRVILATDGDFNVGIRDPEVLKDFVSRKRKSGVYLSVLGFGQGNYNDALMQKLAQNGNGNAAYIDSLNEARKVLVDEASGTMFTIANDVKIQIEFNPAMVAEYRLIGYETRMLNREDFKNDAVDAGDIGSGHSVTAIYEITPTASKAKLIDDLRYGDRKKTESANRSKTAEYAFLKMRYKLPGESSSREIETPIGKRNEYAKISDAPVDSRFASAVAAFGQILRGDSYVRNYGCDDVIALAQGAKGDDKFGYRTEFINLVRLAKTASAMGNR